MVKAPDRLGLDLPLLLLCGIWSKFPNFFSLLIKWTYVGYLLCRVIRVIRLK